MSRHAAEYRATPANADAALLAHIDAIRQLATLRQLMLFEVGLMRTAPFAECGRTIWDLLPTFGWFEGSLPAFDYLVDRWDAMSNHGVERINYPPPTSWPNRVTGHQAIDWYEAFADGVVGEGERQSAWWYFCWAEYAAEADRFGYDESRLPGSELRYGVAHWLRDLDSLTTPAMFHNGIDYHLSRDCGNFYSWASHTPHHPDHFSTAKSLINDIFGNPFRPVVFDPRWRSEAAVGLARTAYDTRNFSLLPILADALEEAGCDHADVLNHCRDPKGMHVRGCWVVDGVLGQA